MQLRVSTHVCSDSEGTELCMTPTTSLCNLRLAVLSSVNATCKKDMHVNTGLAVLQTEATVGS